MWLFCRAWVRSFFGFDSISIDHNRYRDLVSTLGEIQLTEGCAPGRIGIWPVDVPSYRMFLSIPYWSIVIPMTLLSAWLLLSKPRVAKPDVISEKE